MLSMFGHGPRLSDAAGLIFHRCNENVLSAREYSDERKESERQRESRYGSAGGLCVQVRFMQRAIGAME